MTAPIVAANATRDLQPPDVIELIACLIHGGTLEGPRIWAIGQLWERLAEVNA